MEIVKPKLSLDGQIEHLKEKGVLFNIMDEAEARDYLGQHNNYFKLTAYRKNYDKHPAGENKDKYINLEFAYLVDIAVIDMQLRYRIVHMALDLEHHTKLQLLRKMDEYNEDGYQVVQYYIDSLDEKQRKIFDSEINRNKGNIYCGDIIAKYEGAFPVWAFIEIVPFLYTHKDMVESEGIKRSESEDLKKIMERVDKNYDYYNTNPMIKGTFDFLKLVVDSWFKSE